MMFSTKTKVIFISLISALTLTSGAYACSLDGWSNSEGAIAVGQPFGSNLGSGEVDGVSRFEEFCALRVTGTGHVQTDAPSHTRVRGRGYFYPQSFSGSNDSNVLVAYDGADSELFSIAWNDGNWVVSAVGGGSDSTPATAAPGGWDLIEFDWDPSGSGMLDVWVNGDATVPVATSISVSAGAVATLETIDVGLPDGLNGNTGTLYVDSIEMRNETAIGPLLNCDADANAVVEVDDAVAAVDELFQVALASGTPDCDSNGAIEVDDAVAIIDVLFAP